MAVNVPEYSPRRPSRLAKARTNFARWFRSSSIGALDSSRTTVAILKAQQDAMLDGVLVIDPNGHVLSYNRRFLEIWNIPEDVASAANDQQLLKYAAEKVADWNSFIAQVDYLYKNPHEIRNGDPISLKDGRTLMRASVPVVADGKYAGRAWHFRDVTEARRVEVLQTALFRIAQMARETRDLQEFYPEIHAVIKTLMEANNFYIAEFDAEREILNYPYFVDAYDPAPEGEPPGRGCTAFVLRTGKPLLATPEVFERLVADREIELVGHRSQDWLGAPLKTGERTWGVIGVQTYAPDKRLTARDKEILVFVAQQ